MVRRLSIIAICAALSITAGCRHLHLRHNTVRQAHTLATIYEQQVLDNLAVFVQNPCAVPFFAFPTEGDTNLTDDGELATDSFNAFRVGIGGSLKRSAFAGWKLEPVRDPDKLRLMRCAYQRAVCCTTDAVCDACYEKETDFLGEKEAGRIISCENCCGWLCYGTLKDVPKDCCELVGHHCGTYVWVPESGRDHFARLVLRILDYAVHDPVPDQLKTIQYFVGKDGKPVLEKDAVGIVSAVVPIDKDNSGVLEGAKLECTTDEAKKNQIEKKLPRLEPLRGGITPGANEFRRQQRAFGIR